MEAHLDCLGWFLCGRESSVIRIRSAWRPPPPTTDRLPSHITHHIVSAPPTSHCATCTFAQRSTTGHRPPTTGHSPPRSTAHRPSPFVHHPHGPPTTNHPPHITTTNHHHLRAVSLFVYRIACVCVCVLQQFCTCCSARFWDFWSLTSKAAAKPSYVTLNQGHRIVVRQYAHTST